MLGTERTSALDRLLGLAATELDVPEHLQERVCALHDELGTYLLALDKHDRRREPEVYAHGSFALGTVVRPVSDREDFDVDTAYERPIANTTQEQLTADARGRLEGFVEYLRAAGKPVPRLVPKDRCLRLEYDTFHMDVLPAIPEDSKDNDSTRILISDRKRSRWIVTDPLGYCAWFYSRMNEQYMAERQRVADELKLALDQVPRWRVKTPLQRATQIVKRHRDLYFLATPDDKPASIMLATLGGMAYNGEATIQEALRAIALGLEDHQLLLRDGKLFVPNPVNVEENLARRLAEDETLRKQYFAWVSKLRRDIEHLGQAQGLQTLLPELVGKTVSGRALERLGHGFSSARDSQQLRAAPKTAALGAIIGATVPRHTFHGGA